MFEDIDMGLIDGEEEKNFLVVDDETGKVYDIRNEAHFQKFEEKQYRLNSMNIEDDRPNSSNQTKALSDWWKEKRKNN